MKSAKCPRTGVPSEFCSCSLHQTIGGRLDYAALATKHRPVYRDDVERAVRDLAARGLQPADIATSLGITAAAVTALLQRADTQPGAARGDEAAQMHADAWGARRG